jgi:hypothetical protein
MIGSVFIFFGGLMSAINTAVIGRFIDKNPLILLYMNLFFLIIAVIMLFIIWCSKCFVSSGSFTLNTDHNQAKENFETEEDIDSETHDTFMSNGSYHKRYRLASIISLN